MTNWSVFQNPITFTRRSYDHVTSLYVKRTGLLGALLSTTALQTVKYEGVRPFNKL